MIILCCKCVAYSLQLMEYMLFKQITTKKLKISLLCALFDTLEKDQSYSFEISAITDVKISTVPSSNCGLY